VAILYNEIKEQNIVDYKIWPGIINENTRKAIAQAHKQIVLWATGQNKPSVIIAEDDIKFTSKGAFDFFLANEPNDYDIYLGGIFHGKVNNDNTVLDFAGTHLYIIKQHFYSTFLSLPENLDFDRELAHKGRYVVCNPFVAIQHNGYSDNKKRHQEYQMYLKNRAFYHLPLE
jgi:hypothetical protein